MARVRLLVVAIVVFGTFLVLVSPPGNPGALADSAARFSALWPEQTLQPALRVQLRLDAGASSLAWRTNARAVALRFARDVLGWTSPRARDERRFTRNGLENAVLEVAETGDGGGVDSPGEHHVALQRGLRSGRTGIWSVVGVESIRIQAPSWTPRVEMQFGRRVSTWTVSLPNGTRAVAGSVIRSLCGSAVFAHPIYYWRRSTRFQVALRGARTGCMSQEQRRTELEQGYPGYVLIARGDDVRPASADSLFRRPAREPILDLKASTALFVRASSGYFAFPRRPWSIDPRTAPLCPNHRVRLRSTESGEAYPHGGAGVGVRVRASGACRIQEVFHLTVTTASGSLDQPPPPATTTVVRGEQPRDYLAAAWVMANWCDEERPVFTVRGAGQQVTFAGPAGFTTCEDPALPPRIYPHPV